MVPASKSFSNCTFSVATFGKNLCIKGADEPTTAPNTNKKTIKVLLTLPPVVRVLVLVAVGAEDFNLIFDVFRFARIIADHYGRNGQN